MSARTWLEHRIGPKLDSVLERIDRSVPPARHREHAAGILAAPSPVAHTSGEQAVRHRISQHCQAGLEGRPRASDETATSVPQIAATAFRERRYEDGEAERIAHRVAWLPKLFVGTPIAAEAAIESARGWPAQRAAAAHVWLHLATGGPPDDTRMATLDTLLEAHSPGHWFRKRGTWYGFAAVLRASISVSHTTEARADRARELTDRLLRHVEVLRERALGFVPESLPADAEPVLERARFALALLDAAHTFRDLRYLNGALKLVDRGHWELARAGGVSPEAELSHAVTIAVQESTIRELLES